MIGKLPKTTNDNQYIITLMDYFSKWPEAEAVKSKSAETVALFLYKVICRYVCTITIVSYFSWHLFNMCRFGAPRHIISDQGREFVNQISSHLFLLTKTKHRISSAYHPQTNGLVERYNATLQHSLIKLVNENQTDWDAHLDGVLFAYRTSVHKSTGFTPLR